MLSQVDPLLHGVCFDIGFIEINNPLIVVAITIDIAAQRRFAGAGSCFNQIHFFFPEDQILVPYIRSHRITVSKHLGKCLLQVNTIHTVCLQINYMPANCLAKSTICLRALTSLSFRQRSISLISPSELIDR